MDRCEKAARRGRSKWRAKGEEVPGVFEAGAVRLVGESGRASRGSRRSMR